MSAHTLHSRIAELSELHGSLRAAAAEIGVEVSYLSRLASGEKTNPSADTLRALGLRAVTTYEMADCPHFSEPRGCYRVRCQLGRECVEP